MSAHGSGEPPTATWHTRELDGEVGRLTVVHGPDAGSVFALPDDATVGSGLGADVRLDDPTVSRIHCRLVHVDGALRVRDLGSKNGVWIGNCRLHDAELAAPATIRLGSSVVRLERIKGRRDELVWTGGDELHGLFGRTPAMHRLFALIARLAPERDPVLVRGESGSGKELVARALHAAGPRGSGPFVVVDGASLSPATAEIELLGHALGAFTGAHVERPGAFERAHGGTLFIDEVGEIPVEVQPKFLRALDSGTVQRLGENVRRDVDVRVVAATHRPLEQMINEQAFREDLYHRIAVLTLRIPPLRERREDVPLLARRMVEDVAPGDAAAAAVVSRAIESRAGHSWPGNVRELRNVVRRVAALGVDVAEGPVPDRGSVPIRSDLPFRDAKRVWLEVFERRYLQRLLDEAGGNVSEAARRAGMDRGHLSNRIAELRLQKRWR